MYFAIFFENLEKQQINTIATALASSRDILHQQRSNSQVFASLILGKCAMKVMMKWMFHDLYFSSHVSL